MICIRRPEHELETLTRSYEIMSREICYVHSANILTAFSYIYIYILANTNIIYSNIYKSATSIELPLFRGSAVQIELDSRCVYIYIYIETCCRCVTAYTHHTQTIYTKTGARALLCAHRRSRPIYIYIWQQSAESGCTSSMNCRWLNL